MGRAVKLAPSVFAADLARLPESVAALEAARVDLLHVDVMDGHFVEHMAFGATHVKMLKEMTSVPLDVHMMVERPERVLGAFLEAGADMVTVHWESTPCLLACIEQIKGAGAKAGAVLSPATPPEVLEYVLDELDMVLCMTINPGRRKGQAFMPSMLGKIRRLSEMIGDRDIDIEVDGGIDDKTARLARDAGTNVFVSGRYVLEDIPSRVAALRAATA